MEGSDLAVDGAVAAGKAWKGSGLGTGADSGAGECGRVRKMMKEVKPQWHEPRKGRRVGVVSVAKGSVARRFRGWKCFIRREWVEVNHEKCQGWGRCRLFIPPYHFFVVGDW